MRGRLRFTRRGGLVLLLAVGALSLGAGVGAASQNSTKWSGALVRASASKSDKTLKLEIKASAQSYGMQFGLGRSGYDVTKATLTEVNGAKPPPFNPSGDICYGVPGGQLSANSNPGVYCSLNSGARCITVTLTTDKRYPDGAGGDVEDNSAGLGPLTKIKGPGAGAAAAGAGCEPPETCKVIFYVNASTNDSPLSTGHAFVQFRSAGSPTVTSGFYPQSLGTAFGGKGVINDDSSSPWNYRIVYILHGSDCGQAQQDLWQASTNPPNYNLVGGVNSNGTSVSNCTGFVADIAEDLGLALPAYSGIEGVPDPRTLSANMGANLGPYGKGTIEANTDDTTAAGAPDPPPAIPEVGSPTGLALEALSDGAKLASTLGMTHKTVTLTPSAVGVGVEFAVDRSTSTGPTGVYAVSWGDGSDAQTLVKKVGGPTDDTPVSLTHTYTESGNYTYHVAVFTAGTIDDYTGTVTVSMGGPSAEVPITVPQPAKTGSFPPAGVTVVNPKVHLSKSRVRFKISCGAKGKKCAGTLKLESTSGAALGSVRFRIRPGHSATVTIKFSKQALAQIRKAAHGKFLAVLAISAKPNSGNQPAILLTT